jgi:hypothetical protein
LCDEADGFGVVLGTRLMDLGAAEDLESRLVGVVHEEEGDAVVVVEVAEGDVLLVAAQVGKAEERWAEDVEEAGRPAAVLDVGPAGLGDGGHVEAVAEGGSAARRGRGRCRRLGCVPCGRTGGRCRAFPAQP